ncbi:anucleate primary sterigmata protein B [Verticillium alfalfae VaMs.102]|uniref:Anucleate primary sterigmata protein B n=1 Tax=Verticillium alfalfae (strain VaMs.102 / ATCC MYA-4576 / FGSC 10136) TaxID=526221 RepID=C9SG33_VERA1|nr:anucleate primary sterigmata protein B [Verticillium alfalfae VaMs.102]EEY17437.1 anucleate primary sterigmata protein B [Verticillium alfalfae VaMs.102]
MDADENSRPASRDSESRPSTAHRVGGSSSFLGPADFDDSTVSPVKGGNDKTDDDIPGRSGNVTPLRRNDYPSLPPANNAPEVSFVEGATFDDTRHGDDHAETAVRAHLQDVESSFMSRLSPLPTVTTTGADDTYLFDGASSGRTKSPTNRPFAPRAHTDSGRPENELPQLRPNSVHTADVSNTTSSLETLSSSPTAAAARRTVSRALSSLSNDPRRQTSANLAHSAEATDDDQSGADFSMSQSDASGDQSTDRGSVDVGSTPGHALRYGKRPKYLRSRGTSQRSSTSSFVTNPESHDDLDSEGMAGLEIDYALQSGGATGPIMSRTMSNILSRTVSMGSMVSGMGIDDTPEPGATPLETLEEVERSPHNRPLNEDLMKTPKPSKENLSAPTDTVIARHVRNVHVPESLAKEYRSKSGLTTPRKPSDMTLVGSGRSGKNLTLKEQSSTIERLSKENFDLKLKVMFLSDRLDKLSEEGVKEMISENVELKTSLAVVTRDNKALRRRVRELEKKLKEDEDRPSTARSGASSNDQTAHFFDHEANEREEELIYLRERVEDMSKEAEKRKLTEVVKSLGERTGENLGRQEEADVWKDLLEQETARREQADEDNKRMRDEIFRLKQEMTSSHGGSGGEESTGIPEPPDIRLSGDLDSNTNGGFSSTAPTLVEELRRESEQLRHENAELRREVGAQTSMLTSRNREKERLYQEIEDLKIAQRRGGPALSAVDSLLERSASRAGGHHRSMSRTSISRTQITEADEAEREQLENDLSEARDRINEVKLHNQELQRELDGCMEDFETAVDAKQQAEEAATALQEDLETAMADLVALQAERDEALREQADMEAEFEALRKEAQEEIDALENEADQKGEEMQRLQLDLSIRS